MSILLGTGSGSFGSQIIYSTGLNPQWIVAKDVDGDGRLDLVIVNGYSSNVGVMLGIGNGDFTSQITYPTFANPTCVAVDDFDGDGHLDLVVISNTWLLTSVLLGTGHGDFRSQTMFPSDLTYLSGVTDVPYGVAIGDFSGDAQLDLVVTFYDLASVGVFLGTGNGSFGLPTMFSTGSGSTPFGVTVGDFNSDGRLDIAVTDNSAHNTMNVLLNTCM
ncbi:unnamed protein product [Adineta steineri]|nr:unnamed protein product [Adineta steineri]